MPTATQHYDALLAEHYTWLLGGDLEVAAAADRAWLERLGVRSGGVAIDLGCGPGPQTLALSDLGFTRVVGIDTSRQLLDELAEHAHNRPGIQVIHDDLIAALPTATGGATAEVITCMRDTVLHLPTDEAVSELFSRAATALTSGGRLILTYRDLTSTLEGLDRFLPVRSDADRIMLCVLDYPDTTAATVTDLVYTLTGGQWALQKSSYPKLRIAPERMREHLTAAGLMITDHRPDSAGMWTTIASKAT